MKRGAAVCPAVVRHCHSLRPGRRLRTIPVRAFGLLHGACLLGLIALPQAVHAAPVLNPDNGHSYEAVRQSAGITWNAANQAAGARTHNGMLGHLATITSPEENRFIVRSFPAAVAGRYCLGGFQLRGIRDPMAGWQWVTGEPWSYTHWNRLDGGEPNDYYGLGTTSQDENKLQFWENTDGRWNDVRPTVPLESIGYLVEYEPAPSPDAPTITGYVADEARDTAVTGAPPGALLRVMGTNLGREGTVLFDGIPLPAAVAGWSPTEIRLWVPSAPSYPFDTHVTVIVDRQRAEGSSFSIASPRPEVDNLLANASFEFPSSLRSDLETGYTYGQPLETNSEGFNGYSIPGWRIPFGTIDVYRTGWQQAPEQGRQSIDLVGSPNAGTIEQSFYTQAGREYIFTCWMSHNPGVPEAWAIIYLNDEIEQFLQYRGATAVGAMRWGKVSFRFKAPASQTTVTIQDVTGRNYFQGMALDGLSVTLAPN
jgi:Protein of unknown function (DUF642)